MSNDKTVPDQPVEAKDQVEAVNAEAEVTLSPVEQQAMEQGWVTKDQWVESGRAADEWRPAKEFVERGELYKSIHELKRDAKKKDAALTALQRHHQYVFEKAHKQAIQDLRMEKRLAIRNEDFERLEEIETEIEELQETHQKEKAELVQSTQVDPNPSPEFQMFVARNQWYTVDKQLRDEADAIGFVYLNNGGTRETLLGHVEREIKRKFPEKFGVVKKAAPNAVAGVDRTKKAAEKVDIELTPEERQVMRTFVDMGIMSEADYIKDLKKVGR